MLIHVEQIPHKNQRYETCGDWQFMPNGLHINVSDTGNRMSNLLVAIHEIVEAVLCEANGIKEKDVDAFDIEFEKNRTNESLDEPGDDVKAPYHKQHKIADVVERMVALQAGVDWEEHNRRVEDLV